MSLSRLCLSLSTVTCPNLSAYPKHLLNFKGANGDLTEIFMDATSIVKKVFWSLIAAGGIWMGCILLSTKAWVQRQVFYAHKVPIWWGQQLDKPETFGFLKNQVSPFRIPTKDGQRLYAWLVTPLRVYARNERALTGDTSTLSENIESRQAFKLLASDPNSRLIIYFHGNAGTVGQTRRTEAYRMISSGASDTIHVLAFDYRGFGSSTGSPTEEGLIIDAISVIEWAIEVAHIPPSRIVLVAQSIGTALACAAANHYICKEPKVGFAGVVLCAAFTNAATVFLNYSVFGRLPLLAPLRRSTRLSTWFAKQMVDPWKTSDHLTNLVKNSDTLRLTLIHATSDDVIPSTQTEQLFHLAVSAAEGEALPPQAVDDRTTTVDLDEGGWVQSWENDQKLIRQVIVKHGGK